MSNKTTRISSDELSAFAAQGIERALKAREAAGIELNPDQLDQVSGGLSVLLTKGIIAGGPWFDQFKGLNNVVTNPGAGGLAGGIQGATQLG
ncbi:MULTISPECIES: hypothetical protein [Methylomonas]|uniref:Uncharacterized protein n=2 Tax=Methylomonas TaxID=416 RepID=A0A140E3M9_9GAMM|nr:MULTISPECIES: hypothetical protein [Methylomonas]AMK75003.1 hypothetical protein JT25_000630 [Methylomonas denitrificans]OAI02499.1 hypothetical protein A1342_01630 [Methylomonas methanica]TCV83184.1 hypothetical protein EDE11_110143 [Methylomonas methanica]